MDEQCTDGPDGGPAELPIATEQSKPWDMILEDTRPDETLAESCTLPVPARYRPLFPGERVRRGDRVFRQGMKNWERVPDSDLGAIVQESDEFNSARYCRPTHPHSKYWYVDLRPGRGNSDALGSAVDPFDSVENARRAIYRLAQACGEGPFGMLWDVRGEPLEAYDLPEPPEDPHSAQAIRRRIIEARDTRGVPASLAGMAPVPPSPTWIDERPNDSTTTPCVRIPRDQLDQLASVLEEALQMVRELKSEHQVGGHR
jgi:hypothetical protein